MNIDEKIFSELEKMSNYFVKKDFRENQEIGLFNGLSGEILLLGLEYLRTKDEIYLNCLNERVLYIIDSFDDEKKVNTTLTSGIAGFSWCISLLSQNGIIDCDDDFFENFDLILEKQIKIMFENNQVDQLNEALGIAQYFIKRGNLKILEFSVDFLAKTVVTINDENVWEWEPWNKRDTFVYDFSLAHGITGKLAFLYQCFQLGVKKSLCKEIIIKGLNFLTNNIQDITKSKCFFPNQVLANSYNSGQNSTQYSRLAWCYGDLGVWYSIYNIASGIGLNDFVKLAIDGLKITSKRRGFDDTSVVDAGFCHGSSGIAYIYNKLWRQVSDSDFQQAALYWYDETVKYGENDYKYLAGNFEERDFTVDDSLLEGNCGVALSYLSFIDSNHINWDNVLLLS
ncbi:hypothetical protein DWB61_09730 [Ancylomarina euxinus]|uniref:Lanthionine synthetase n=1 Tax=Ancylomarina euxinus TaxID=2283627 RepID=A0A425Y0X7_9BACT|nr:lanthionine synthetase LanC family protein [Ancylomarina euxinus]MCZ4693792.1 hypothetical protein [Ancylomarina euxinus]MUP15128.1 hypothetical protein [Ancylomarina euxinus]RRG21551.1 hypothetical protein DWB61_09730 [Ancylomarina euxinus]